MIPANVDAQLKEAADQATSLGTALRALSCAAASCSSQGDGLRPLQQAHLQLTYAQTLNSLLHMLMRASGADPMDQGPAQKEYDRLKQYKKKVGKASAEEELRKSRPTISLNVAAANRFIDHAIPDLTDEQRKKLRDASSQQTGKRDRQEGPGKKQQSKAHKASDGVSAKDAAMQFLQQVAGQAQQRPPPESESGSEDE